MENQTDILVFKTNIKTEPDQQRIKQIFDTHPSIHHWNVDTDDIDCILRVVTRQVSASEIIRILTETGYQCQELD